MVIIRILLLPLAALYNLVTAIRNRLYDLGLKPSARFDIPLIDVGNLRAGGTGKTPMIEHLIRLLASKHGVATLSRGYGRKTKGMRVANSHDDAFTLGDEPFQFYKKFGQQITVAVGEDRALAIPHIINQFPDTEVILLDDAYQHRAVTPSFNILLTDYQHPFYNDFLLPAGRLRESRMGAGRADVVVVTKCAHDLPEERMMEIEKNIRKYVKCPVFFSMIRYGSPIDFGGQGVLGDRVVLVSGIASPRSLVEYVVSNFTLVQHIIFPDHHFYTQNDLNNLRDIVKRNPGVSLLTTEKDKVKLESVAFASVISEMPAFYLPIETEFIKNGKDFDEMVLNVLSHAGDK
jgi:tetraacyldisaccharide 4'-kinase